MKNKINVLILAVLLIPLLRYAVRAGTTYVGQATQPVSGAITTQVLDGAAAAKSVGYSVAGASVPVSIQVVDGASNPKSAGYGVNGASVPVSIQGTPAVTQSGTWTVQPGNTANTTAWLFTSPAVSAPTVTKVGATTSSAQLIASNATRKGIEVDTDCANTDSVAINFGASAAVYASHKIIPPCGSWNPPQGVVVTSAIQVISNTGTQQVRVIEYP